MWVAVIVLTPRTRHALLFTTAIGAIVCSFQTNIVEDCCWVMLLCSYTRMRQSLVLDVRQQLIPVCQNGMQGFYVTLVYHGISIAYGGDAAIQDKDAWIADWVSLVKQVLKSDACEVS